MKAFLNIFFGADIDECASNPCVSHSTCKNSNGSFECLCKRGYSGDGRLRGNGCTRLSLPLSNIIQIVFIGKFQNYKQIAISLFLFTKMMSDLCTQGWAHH